MNKRYRPIAAAHVMGLSQLAEGSCRYNVCFEFLLNRVTMRHAHRPHGNDSPVWPDSSPAKRVISPTAIGSCLLQMYLSCYSKIPSNRHLGVPISFTVGLLMYCLACLFTLACACLGF